ncbi:uncharacterized protein LOC114350876 [Ostrinia furnacalis]|uniref:uncharacterized protein LOC114350876 n=1 Tax=Ostrinia furnacalis TaxID=93504 RepID=UPI001038E68B|nr:uncharacterized protein LOC114350876 [Ostrinia furnacalis]
MGVEVPQASSSGLDNDKVIPPPPEALPRLRWAVYKSHRTRSPELNPVLERHYDDLLRWVKESHPWITHARLTARSTCRGRRIQTPSGTNPPQEEPSPGVSLLRFYRQIYEYYLHLPDLKEK